MVAYSSKVEEVVSVFERVVEVVELVVALAAAAGRLEEEEQMIFLRPMFLYPYCVFLVQWVVVAFQLSFSFLETMKVEELV